MSEENDKIVTRTEFLARRLVKLDGQIGSSLSGFGAYVRAIFTAEADGWTLDISEDGMTTVLTKGDEKLVYRLTVEE